MKNVFLLLAVIVLGMSSCANPPYKFAKDQPYAYIKPVEGQSWNICSAGKYYELQQLPKSKLLKIPAGQKIVLSNYATFSGYQVSYSCFPMIGFTPEAGKTYVGDLMIGMTGCNIGLAEEDKEKDTGLKPVYSLSKPVCTAQ